MKVIVDMMGLTLVCCLLGLFCLTSTDKQNYMEGKKIVEKIPFDKLDDLNNSRLEDGTNIIVKNSIEYPEDKIIEYKSVVFPVENDNGHSKVIATYQRTNCE